MIMSHATNIRVLQTMHGDLEYFPWSEKINRHYCERHGYEYLIPHGKPRQDRHANWQKIPDILGHLDGCDYLLFLDADAHFYSLELTIEQELIPLMAGRDILMAQDVADETSRWNPGMPNAGVILMKTGANVRNFFETWDQAPEIHGDCRWNWPPIQRGLWHVVLPHFSGLVKSHDEYYMIQGRYGQYIRHYVFMSNEERILKMQTFCRLRQIG
jgi:hypothetical protein